MTKSSIVLTAIAIMTLSVIYGGIAAHYIVEPIQAASMSDVQSGSSNNNSNLTSSGSTEPQPINNNSNSLVLTAIPDKGIIAAGDTQTIHIKAATANGTGIPDLLIQALVMDYATGKQKVLLGGQTNEKGELDVMAAIGPHAKSGQFLVIVNATKDNKKSSIATGFAAVEKGSASSSGSSTMTKDSKGRCSGSGCK